MSENNTRVVHGIMALLEESAINNSNNAWTFKKEINYFNYLPYSVTICDRLNVPIRFEKAANNHRDACFITRVTYYIDSKEVISNIISQLEIQKTHNMNTAETDKFLKAIKERTAYRGKNQYVSISIDYKLTMATLDEIEEAYITDVDLYVTKIADTKMVLHPISSLGMQHDVVSCYTAAKKLVGMFIDLVDNENNIGDRYMYVANSLMKIRPRKDPTMRSGVYYNQVDNMDGNYKPCFNAEFYTFEEAAKKLGLYPNKEDAMTAGNPEVISRTKMQEMEHSLVDAKHSLEQSKIQLEKNKNEAKESELTLTRELTELKHQQQLAAMEVETLKKENLILKEKVEKEKVERVEKIEKTQEAREERKQERTEKYDERKTTRNDRYEERSSKRKDTSEIIKWIPAVILAAVGIFAWWKK